ncbi:6-phosphogluconolactonase [candidate division KSB1 bacterium]|nr:MAG: 6-phosphogluconolactonase [candidate division KSB1 bacterium]
MRNLVLCETPDDVADAAADLIYDAQTTAIKTAGIYHLALSGGETLRALFERLSSPEWKDTMSWESWEVFWCDERAVPPDHPDSNFKAANDLWLSKVPVSDVWRMRAESSDLREAADEYARTLRSRLGLSSPILDTILLGMGKDGHTASLFPGHKALKSGSLVEVVEGDDPVPHRLTLTLPVLNRARQVIFMAAGEDKADAVLRIFEQEDRSLPAALVDPADGECLWILDHAAARLIR